MPQPGDQVTTADGIRLTAEEVRQNRITKVRILLPEEKADEEAAVPSDEPAQDTDKETT